ncbi:MAG: FAD-dependent oxidoreductase [Alphaproteobacteria bacterium]|nr:FAD-dependent oxidoreductase [Alphaproteobacteria bacterium]
MKTVIIGGGIAGISTATHLRRRDENAEIIILEKNKEFGVSSCALPYLLSGIIEKPEDITGATVEQMWQIFKIDVRLEHEVIDIDRKNKMLILEGKTPVSYDNLVIATGAIQLRPDIEGVLGDNIFTLRNLESVDKMKLYFEGTDAHDVLILGASNIGLETAEAFIRLGAKVCIVEETCGIMPDFDPEIVRRIENHLRNVGVKLYLRRKVTAFCDNYALLDNGIKINYDMVIIATGVRPDVKLPIMANIHLGHSGGIITNQYMQTNDPDIFAAGDNVEFINAITKQAERQPSTPRSIMQANVIANFLSGHKTPIGDVITYNISPIFGYTMACAGANEKQLLKNGIEFKHIYLLQNNCDLYMPNSQQMLLKLIFTPDGKILGIQGVGRCGIDKRIDIVANLIKKGGTVEDLSKIMISYSPPYSMAKDALINLGNLACAVVREEIHYYNFEKLSQNEDIFLVDIRQAKSFETRHLPHAVNFPLATIRDNLACFPHDKKIVLYCGNGYGAYIAYCILRNCGFDNAYLLNTPYDLTTDL